MAEHLVAVYGTLRRGEGNYHYFLDRSRKLGVCAIEGWDMYSLGAFPFVTPGEGKITIEVFKVDDTTFRELDGLEGYPDFYDRKVVETAYGPAWIYFMEPEEITLNPRIDSGDWVNYKNHGGW
jgi:gamma-glutamylcyclotransferase (GGCT)/AIG2-like uncharacterized protein YtfP